MVPALIIFRLEGGFTKQKTLIFEDVSIFCSELLVPSREFLFW